MPPLSSLVSCLKGHITCLNFKRFLFNFCRCLWISCGTFQRTQHGTLYYSHSFQDYMLVDQLQSPVDGHRTYFLLCRQPFTHKTKSPPGNFLSLIYDLFVIRTFNQTRSRCWMVLHKKTFCFCSSKLFLCSDAGHAHICLSVESTP